MMKRLPKTIYVKWEKTGNDDPYLIAADEMYGLVDPGAKIAIGTYQLVETTEAEMIVKTSPAKKSR